MNDKQNNANQSDNTTSSSNTISQDIFVRPNMSSETRGESNSGVQMRNITEGLEMRRTTFTKDEDN